MLRLTPSAFDDRAAWSIVLAQTYHLQGDTCARASYADTARMAFEEQLRGAPDDAQRTVASGARACLPGPQGGGVADGEKAVALMPISR